MNILILGGSGFIGSRVAKILRERQHDVTTPSHAELDLMRLDLDAAQRLLHGLRRVARLRGELRWRDEPPCRCVGAGASPRAATVGTFGAGGGRANVGAVVGIGRGRGA